MIDHVTLRVRDFAASKAFYAAALAPLGYKLVSEYPEAAGFGAKGRLDFWLAPDAEARPQHIAFSAPTRAAVGAFHAAALSAGATDNGPPGLRLDYHPNYFAAFVLDPSGHNMEAVCHLAAPAARPKKRPAKRVAKVPKGLARGSKAKKIARRPKGR